MEFKEVSQMNLDLIKGRGQNHDEGVCVCVWLYDQTKESGVFFMLNTNMQ